MNPHGHRRSTALALAVLLAGAAVHVAGMISLWVNPEGPVLSGYLDLDAAGKVVLSTSSALFLASAVYAQGYLRSRDDRDNRVFVGGLLILLSAMTTVGMAQHLGVLWVAIEITTLATAPLIYFNHNARSLEAAWKYLLVSSLGIALALLGTFFLALSGAGPGGPKSLLLADLVREGGHLSRPWVRAAFVFLLVGYGTKMGLAPLHSWKPDAYGEAPGLLGALLAGGITNFAFLSVVRVFQVTSAAGEGAFASDALLALGLLSMALAAVFMAGQRDFKRMLAYSSVEHMGILAVALGLGGSAVTGAFYHVLNNGLAKGVLFLAAGNIHRAYGSKRTDEVRGAARRLPVSGPLFLAGFLAVIMWSVQKHWMLVPVLILFGNALILAYCAITGRWSDWVFLWMLEPLIVGVAVYIPLQLTRRTADPRLWARVSGAALVITSLLLTTFTCGLGTLVSLFR